MGPGFDVGIGGGPGTPPRFPGGGGMGRDIRDPGRGSRLDRRKSKEMAMEDRRRRRNDRSREMRDDRNRERRERMERDRNDFEKRRRSRRPRPNPPRDRPGINPPRDRPSINPIRSNDPRREYAARDAFLKKRGIQVWDNAEPGTPVASYSPGFKNESYFASDRAGAAGFSNEQGVKDFMKSMGQRQFPGESPGQDSVQSDFLKGNLDRYTQFLSLLKGFRNRR